MPLLSHRVVLDTNILVRGLINLRCDSGRILIACEQRKVIPLLADPDLVTRYPELNDRKVRTAIERLIYIGQVWRTDRIRFLFPRDKKDEMLITLAIAGAATHLITTARDLLDLPNGRSEASKRFRQRLPNMLVHQPEEFVAQFGAALRIERSSPEFR